MDPVTGIAIASTAYKAICTAFQHGREIEQMAGDLGRWMQGINAVKEGHSKAKGRRIGSVEEEALETFAAMKKAEQMENELRNFITGQYGMNAWQQIIKIQADIRVKQREAKIEEARRQEEIFEYILLGVSVFLASIVIMCVLYYALMQ
jgi:membrane protease subunit (stomatin/prohibitin family)